MSIEETPGFDPIDILYQDDAVSYTHLTLPTKA